MSSSVRPGLASFAPTNGEFDFIIVGGGTGGCTLAARLSEDPKVTVCLIEAGKESNSLRIRTPGAVGMAHMASDLGWGYASVPQLGLNGRQINLARGRVLGGTSAINGMVYFRGPASDYDAWRDKGNPGWAYEDVLPYFRRSEGNIDWPDSELHHTGGPVAISSLRELNPLVPRFLHAAESLGLPHCADFNVPAPEGFGTRQLTIRDGERETAATAFLKPIQGRSNLAVLTGSLTRRVLFDTGRAMGVEVEQAGEVKTLRCRRETILCAGAYNTPQILLRSGLGPGHELQELGITTITDAQEVGKNLRDHVSACVQASSVDTASYALSWRTIPRVLWNLVEYAAWRRGPLASNLFEAAGFVRTSAGLPCPDLHLVLNAFRRPPPGRLIPFRHGCAILSTVLRPHSHGSVTLASPDPHVAPRIDPAFLQDDRDVRTMVHGLKLARQLMESPAFADMIASEVEPGPDVNSDAQWEHYARASAFSVYHPGGTCRMGGDARAVVDPQLRVRGVERLRIADASIYPTLISGNTNASVMMIAEKAADMILARPPLPRAPSQRASSAPSRFTPEQHLAAEAAA